MYGEVGRIRVERRSNGGLGPRTVVAGDGGPRGTNRVSNAVAHCRSHTAAQSRRTRNAHHSGHTYEIRISSVLAEQLRGRCEVEPHNQRPGYTDQVAESEVLLETVAGTVKGL